MMFSAICFELKAKRGLTGKINSNVHYSNVTVCSTQYVQIYSWPFMPSRQVATQDHGENQSNCRETTLFCLGHQYNHAEMYEYTGLQETGQLISKCTPTHTPPHNIPLIHMHAGGSLLNAPLLL